MTGDLDALDLGAIKARAAAAQRGPWVCSQVADSTWWAVESGEDSAWDDIAESISRAETANFIAHSRTDVPALIAEVERLREQVARVRHVLPGVHDKHQHDGRCLTVWTDFDPECPGCWDERLRAAIDG